MQWQLDDKVALVTGASRGIGQAIALALGQAGAIVVGTATTEQGAANISHFLQEHNIQGTGLVLNITQIESIESVVDEIKTTYRSPDILVNNAAITEDNILLRMKEEQWQQVIDTNLTSIFRMSKACLRGMVKARWGRIINVSSVSGFSGNLGQSNYAAAKAGLVGFSKSLAIEVATRNITVNVVAPGFIQTDMTKAIAKEHAEHMLKMIPMQRMGEPKEVASAVAYLASPAASYITGATLHANGGMYMD